MYVGKERVKILGLVWDVSVNIPGEVRFRCTSLSLADEVKSLRASGVKIEYFGPATSVSPAGKFQGRAFGGDPIWRQIICPKIVSV